MILDVKVPVLAESVAEATLLSWQKQPGDVIKRGDTLIEIETDKVVLEVPAPGDGVLKEILKQDGTSVTSDELLARVDTDYAAEAIPDQAEPPQILLKDAAAKATAADAPPPLAVGPATCCRTRAGPQRDPGQRTWRPHHQGGRHGPPGGSSGSGAGGPGPRGRTDAADAGTRPAAARRTRGFRRRPR